MGDLETTKEMDITVDSSVLTVFPNMPMEMFKVFREFIDNSLQSYLDHKEKLDSLPKSAKKLVVIIGWSESEIVIKDNAWGMDEEAFSRALKLNKTSSRSLENDRLSRFGWGLKTAANYASRDYIINSAAFGSQKRYKTEMNLDYIGKYSPKTVPVTISDCLATEHGTEIRLKKLNPRCRFNVAAEKKVRAKLARIYNKMLGDGDLEISINGETIIYEEPKFLIDPKTGNDAIRVFGNPDGFEFDGKRYRYEGWLGVMKVGDSSGDTSGFQYYQAKRVIVFSDHPHELFHAHNDARFQHVVGEIELLGNEWPVTTNKDQLQWEDSGLKDAFIKDLLHEEAVNYIFKLAKDTKFRATKTPPVLPPVTPPATPPTTQFGDPVNGGDAIPPSGDIVIQPVDPTIPPVSYAAKTTKRVTFNNTTYKMDFTAFEDEPDRDWLTLKSAGTEGDPNRIEVEINLSSPFIAEYTGDSSRKVLFLMAEVFALARVEAVQQGLKMNDSFVFEQTVNEIMRKAK